MRAKLEPRSDLGPAECGPRCPHCKGSMVHICEECQRQYSELRHALNLDDGITTVDLHRVLDAVNKVYPRSLPREKGNWGPALPAIREGLTWLRADNEDLAKRPPSKQPAFFRPLEKYRAMV